MYQETVAVNNTVPTTNAATASAIESFEAAIVETDFRAIPENKEFFKIVGPQPIWDFADQVAAIAAEYQAYQVGKQKVIAHTRKQKLEILGKCYAQYIAYKGQKAGSQKRIEADLDDYMEANGINFEAKTMVVSKILMCVFAGADPKKINVYCQVFKYAEQKKRHGVDFADFVLDHGGIEAIRKQVAASNNKPSSSNKQPALSREDKLQSAIATANSRNIAVFESPELSQIVQPEIADKLVLIVTQVGGGKYQVNAAVPDESVVNTALFAFYKANAEQLSSQSNHESEMAKQVAQDQSIDDLVASKAA